MKPPSIPPASPDKTGAASTPALEWAASRGLADEVSALVAMKLRRRRRRRFAAAGAALVMVVTGVAFFRPTVSPIARAATPIAPDRSMVLTPATQILADGTKVELKDDARLAVEFTAAFRRVTLQRGEAHFQVAKDAARPFIVTAGGIEVRAVGTAFAVQLSARAVDILVTEGHVAVEQPAEHAESDRRHVANLEAGHRLMVERTLAPPPPVETLSPQEIEERLAWRVPRLDLGGTPLSHALTLFNQYTPTRIVLGDPELGTLELSGLIRADNADSLLRLLQMEFGIVAEPRADEIVLRRR